MSKLKNTSSNKYHEVKDGWYYFDPSYFSDEDASFCHHRLLHELHWEQHTIRLFGKTHLTPRLEAYYSDDNLSYSYSGKKLTVNSFPDFLRKLKQKLEGDFEVKLNAVLANLYRNGGDSNGWHADDEPELGKNPLIFSLSFGATRRFDLKHKQTSEKVSLNLNHGSLLIMGGELQHFWKHQLPKSLKIEKERINLTFRYIF